MAGNNIKGITVEINGETGPLDKALKGVNQTSRDLQKELREVEKGLKMDPGNAVLLAQKQQLLAESITNTKNKLGTLKTAEEQAQRQFAQGRISEEQYRALQREVITTEQSLGRLETQARQSNAVLSSDQATGNLKNMAKAAGVAALAVSAAFVGMGVAAMNNADELQRQADVTGLSAERLQELQYAGNNLGVELDVITGAQAKLTKSMDAAKGGTGAQAEAFKALGISVIDGNGHLKNAKDVMGEAFTALGKVGNETERDALSMKLFGKSAMEMNPMIKAGGEELNRLTEEAKNNGAVMSNEAVAGLDAFGDTIDNIKNAVLGSVGEKLAGLMPKLQGILDKMIQLPQWIRENSTLLTIIGVVIGTVTALVIAFNIQQALLAKGLTLWGAIAGVGTTITTSLGVAFAFLTSPIGLVILAIGAVIAIGILLYKNWDEIKTWAATIFPAIWESIKGAFAPVLEFFRGIWDGIKAIFSVCKDVFLGFFTLAWEAIKAYIGLWVAIFQGIWDGIAKVFSVCKDVLLGFFTVAWEAIKAYVMLWVAVFQFVWDGIKLVFSVVKDVLLGFFTLAWNAIKAYIGFWVSVFQGIWDGIAKVFSVCKEVLTGFFIAAWEAIKNVFSGVGAFFGGIWDIIKEKFTTIGSSIGNAMGDAFKVVVNSVINFAENTINGFIGAINGAINMINKIPGVSISPLHTLDIPRLAKGGIVDSATTFIAGEAGREVVMPLENNTGWITQLADKVYDRMPGNGQNGITQHVIINSPVALSPSETARQNKRALQELAFNF